MRRVRVGRKIYPAYVDEHGVLRFQPNRILRRFVDDTFTRPSNVGFNLNQLAIDYAFGAYTLEEMIEFYTSINYSVDGFRDVLDSLLENDPAAGDTPRTMNVTVLD